MSSNHDEDYQLPNNHDEEYQLPNVTEEPDAESLVSFNSADRNEEETLDETCDETMDSDADNSIIECPLCRDSSQYKCRKYWKPVCILFCSIKDPSSDNEMYAIQKPGDSRWTVQNFDCPN